MLGLGKNKEIFDEKDKFLESISQGWESKVVLPEIESVGHGMVTKGVATAALGIVGLAMTMGSSNKPRTINTIVRIPKNGIVIEKGTVDGKDIKIPWGNILAASKKNGTTISLVDGSIITIMMPPVLKKKMGIGIGKPDDLINFINERASGQVEEGW